MQPNLTLHLQARFYEPIWQTTDPIIQLIMFMIVTLTAVLRLSRRGSKFVLSITAYLLFLSFMLVEGPATRDTNPLSPRKQKTLFDIPNDPDTIIKHFHLNNEYTIYAVCPKRKCHRTYKPITSHGSLAPEYPMHCTHREFEGDSVCGARLTRPRTIGGDIEIQVPIKTFVAFSFKEYLAKLLARFEASMDASWAKVSVNEEMFDVFDGEFLREFKFKGKHFSQGDGEGRYVFGLGFDGFNPFTNKQAGKKYSLGVIVIVCFNLPPEDRYKPENMFLAGIPPGPHEPPTGALNHYATPIVDEFLEFWDPGVKYSQTALHPEGRLVRVALVAVISDLLAARKISGFGSPTCEHFCTFCHVCRKDGGWFNTDRELWKWRTNEECRAFASQHKAAPDEKARKMVFDSAGVRHSELERLPYFDFTKSIVVDPMHNLFLGLIKEHFRVLGMALPKLQPEAVTNISLPHPPDDFTKNEVTSINRLKNKLELPLCEAIKENREKVAKQLEGYHLKSLRFVSESLCCSLLHISEPKRSRPDRFSKAEWARVILNWVCAFSFHSITTLN